MQFQILKTPMGNRLLQFLTKLSSAITAQENDYPQLERMLSRLQNGASTFRLVFKRTYPQCLCTGTPG